jgi:hypothetical protein
MPRAVPVACLGPVEQPPPCARFVRRCKLAYLFSVIRCSQTLAHVSAQREGYKQLEANFGTLRSRHARAARLIKPACVRAAAFPESPCSLSPTLSPFCSSPSSLYATPTVLYTHTLFSRHVLHRRFTLRPRRCLPGSWKDFRASSSSSSSNCLPCSPPPFLLQITQPVASTTFPVGQNITVQWQDDTTAPSLAQIGVSDVGVYAGNAIQQTLLQQIGTLDVSVNNSITFVINSDIGPAGKAN